MFRVQHFRDRCIGCNACVELAYGRWRMSRTDGKAVLIGATSKKGIAQITLPEEELEENIKAEAACPVKVIRIMQ